MNRFVSLAVLGLLLLTAQAEAAARLAIVERHVGLHERTNRTALRKLMGVDPVRTKWCGYFVAYVVERAGGKAPSGYPAAKSWARWGNGVPVTSARPGDIVVIRTRRGHHVTVYKARVGDRIVGCGGNQSNRVKCSSYSVRAVRAVRR